MQRGRGSDIGERLRRRRERAGLTQREAATRSGVSVRALRDIERGRVRTPRPDTVGRLAEAFGFTQAETAVLLADLAPYSGTAGGTGPPLWVEVLGPLTVRRDGLVVELRPGLPADLLGLLAVQPGTVVSTDEVVDVLWGEKPPRSCRRLVHTYVGQVRAVLEPTRPRRSPGRILQHIRSGLMLVIDGEELDLARFRSLTFEADRARAGSGTGADRLLATALDLWRGPPLAGAGERLRQHPAVASATRQRVAAALRYGDLALADGEYEQAVCRLGAVFATESLHEGLAARLVLAMAGSGDQAAALALYTDVRRRLAEELGIEPGRELSDAHLRVVRGEVPTGRGGQAPVALPAPDGTATTARRRRRELDRPAQTGTPAPGERPVPRQLPAAVRHFVGRHRELKRLDDLAAEAMSRRATSVVAVDGPGGIGKTTLVVHWAHTAARQFPDGQLFVNLRGHSPTGPPLSIPEVARGLLDALDVPPSRVPTDLDAQIGLFRSMVADRRMLLIFDDIPDPEQIRPLIPAGNGSLVIVTSRRQLTFLAALEDAHLLPLPLFTDAEARELVHRWLTDTEASPSPATVDELVRHCAGLPLALSVGSAHTARRTSAPDGKGPGHSTYPSDVRIRDDLRTVFARSYRALLPGPARLFRFLGLHRGVDVGLPVLNGMLAEAEPTTRGYLAELIDRNLVDEPTPGRFSVHDLVRAYAAELAVSVDGPTGRNTALRRLLEHYLHSAHAANVLLLEAHLEAITLAAPLPGLSVQRPIDRAAAYRWFTVERRNLLAAVDLAVAEGFDRHAWQLAWTLITFLNRRGMFTEQLQLQQCALAAAERADDVVGQAQALRAVGGALSHLGQHDAARVTLTKALHAFAAAGAWNGQASCHFGLSFLGTLAEDSRGSIAHVKAALALFQRAGHRRGEATALSALGWHHAQLGDLDDAARYCEAALRLHRAAGDQMNEAHTLDSLGVVHQRRGDQETALARFWQAYATFEAHDDSFLSATVLDHIGDSEQARGEFEAARDAWTRSLRLLDRARHPSAEKVRAKLAPA